MDRKPMRLRRRQREANRIAANKNRGYALAQKVLFGSRDLSNVVGSFLRPTDLLSVCQSSRGSCVSFFDAAVVSLTHRYSRRSSEQKIVDRCLYNDRHPVDEICVDCACVVPDIHRFVTIQPSDDRPDGCGVGDRHLIVLKRTFPDTSATVRFLQSELRRLQTFEPFATVLVGSAERMYRSSIRASAGHEQLTAYVDGDVPMFAKTADVRYVYIDTGGVPVGRIGLRCRIRTADAGIALRLLTWSAKLSGLNQPNAEKPIDQRLANGSDGDLILTADSAPPFDPRRPMNFRDIILLPGTAVVGRYPIFYCRHQSVFGRIDPPPPLNPLPPLPVPNMFPVDRPFQSSSSSSGWISNPSLPSVPVVRQPIVQIRNVSRPKPFIHQPRASGRRRG